MANNYEQIMALVNAGNKMGLSNAITRDNGIPLDLSSVYNTYEDAVVYAATKAIAYQNQIIAAEGTVYVIVEESQGKVEIGGVQYDNYLKPVGTAPTGDNASITVTAEGLVSVFGFAGAQNGMIPVRENGALTWKTLEAIGAGDGNDNTTYQFTLNAGGNGIVVTPLFNGQPIYDGEGEDAPQIKYEVVLDVYNKGEADEKFLAKADYTPYDDTALADRVKALEDEERYDETPLANRVSAIEDTLGDADDGLVKDVADNTTAIATEKSRAEAAEAKVLEDAEAFTTGQIAGLSISIEKIEGVDNLVLKNDEGETVANVDATPFIKDGMLESAEYNVETKKLVLTWNTAAGITSTEIDLNGLVDTYTGGTGITVGTDGVISVDGTIATVGALNGVKATAEAAQTADQVAQAIATAIAGYAKTADVNAALALKADKTALDNYYTKDVVETALSKKIETGSIAHSSESLVEGVTVSGTNLNIVVDAYTKQEVRDYVADVIEDMTGGESAADVLLALNNHIDTYNEKVGQIDTKNSEQDTAIAALQKTVSGDDGHASRITALEDSAATLASEDTRLAGLIGNKANVADVYNKTQTDEAIRVYLQAAKDSGEFDGKNAFQYAQDAGYTGSEAEFASKLANDEIYFGDDEVMPEECNLQIFSDGNEEFGEYAPVDHNHDGVYVKLTELNDEVNKALETAKESGDFNGTSVTVSKVTESTASGGSNIVTFSDGKTLTVKNGKDGKTATIPAHWEAPVNECIAKIKALQVGRNCVTFPFFSDNHGRDGNPQYMGMLIAKVMEECNIPYCFCGGDAIPSARATGDASKPYYGDSDAEFRTLAQEFKEAMSYIPDGRFCMALGNHETWLTANSDVEGSTRVDYNRDQTYDIFLREQGVWQNKHFGGDGTYYYVDDLPSKVRWIVLNTNGIGNANIDADQLDWFENTALKFAESGWGVVIISHVPITNHYAQSNIGNNIAVISMLQSYMGGEDENKADIIGWFSGHIHRDRIYEGVSVNDTDSSESENKMGFKQVTITSDHTVIAYKNDDGTTSPTYHPVSAHGCGGTCVKNHAIDFVTINKDKKTVNITRLGIGSDRSYTYGVYEEPTITNFADTTPTSEDPSLTYGWLTDYRLNSTNVTKYENVGMVVTNMIDTNSGDKVYVYGLDMSVSQSAYVKYLQNVTIEGTTLKNNSRLTDQATHYDSAMGCYVFDGFSGWLRFCGVPTSGAENVVINIQRNGEWL